MSVTAPRLPEEAASPIAPSGSLRMTYEEYLDWLDEDKHADWVDGEVVMHSPISFHHTRISRFLIGILLAFVDDGDLGEIAHDPFLMKTGPDLPARIPDVLFVAQGEPASAEGEPAGRPGGSGRGDRQPLRVEDVTGATSSTSTRRGGVREYWLLDPERQQAEFYQLGSDGHYALAALDAQGRYRSRVLPGFSLPVEWLWRDRQPTLREA